MPTSIKLSGQHVKAFLTGNKNDINDALAIVIASQQSHIKSVEVKTEEQQDSQTLHKIRELAVRQGIPSIGPLVASALFNEMGNGSAYRKGRDVSASLGLVPKQYSSGGKDQLLGISKRGNHYLRCLLILGAKAVVSRAKHKTDALSLWINRLVAQRGHNRARVAYANKIARMAWAITVSGEQYQSA